MPNLLETQKALHDFLQGKASPIKNYVKGKTSAEVNRRLDVYKEAYQLRLQSNLKKQYPVLVSYLGEDAFIQLAQNYDLMFPAKDFAIRHYGKHMARFLQQDTTYQAKPYLAALASFEWAMNVALDESLEAPILSIEDFQKVSQEDLLTRQFYLNPSLQFLSLDYDIATFWQSIRNKAQAIHTPTLISTHYALWRRKFLPYFRKLEQHELTMINAVQQGKNFTEICELFSMIDSENATQIVVNFLLRWLNDGWLVSNA